MIHRSETALGAGRFRGPIEVKLPARAKAPHSWVEIHAELEAACTPLLLLRYPDGEMTAIGAGDERWQALLRARAEHRPAAETTGGDTTAAAAEPEGRGRWERVETESWPGQLEFRDQRAARCGERHRYTAVHYTALDQNQPLALWADVPQELDGATLRVRVYEVIDLDAMREDERRRARAEARARAHVEVRAERGPIPPRPKPKKEKRRPSEVEASWTAGYWFWHEERWAWVWIDGYYEQPGDVPALRAEDGVAPVAGCTFTRGHWAWARYAGRWEWVPGYWNAPPPRVETPGTPPVPESSWVAGRWIRAGASFEWIAGHWGKPRPRAETRPPSPRAGARWHPGVWINVDGTWVWSPGFYDRAGQKPPPPKRETRGPKPHPKAVWLAGFWRWDASKRRYAWFAGRWERPPGEGYVWVADPIDPATGVSPGGKWVLEVDVKVDVGVKVRPR